MPFEVLKPGHDVGRRVLISGPPNSRKTSSLHTWPFDADEGLHIVCYPGEKGWDSIDTSIPGVHAYVWKIEDPAKASPFQVVKEVEDITAQILTGKFGKVKTFAGDGLHKLYGWYYRREYDKLAASGGDHEKISGRAFGLAHDEFQHYLHRTCHTSCPYMAFTVWDGREKDNPEDKASNAPTHIFPDLPGQMAKRIMGEFSVVVYASVGLPPGPGKPAPASWQLLPSGKVWGAGVKVPAARAKGLPTTCEQDFKALERLLLAGSLTDKTQQNPQEGTK